MACFVVPAAEAVVTTVVSKVMESKESAQETIHTEENSVTTAETGRIPFSRKLKWLNNLLWGGSALLAFEHVWHGEIVPWLPFLSAANNPADMIEVLHEMSTAGVAMALVVTAVWGCMVGVTNLLEKKMEESASPVSSDK
ncbi:MAG: hypothetical protein J1E62_02655 [Lachnospiraceae bacterium]|nr:hypothetical protein [Lachnospiraceae bacterium]